MTEPKTKTIGLSLEVWRALKLYAIEQNCTLSEAVQRLLADRKVTQKGAVPRTK